MNNVVRLPTSATLHARALELQEEQGRAIANIDWHARAAFAELEKAAPNIAFARNLLRRILATTTGQT